MPASLILAALLTGAAPVDERAVWREDVQATVQAVLPHALSGFAGRCRDHLPADAYLLRNAQRLTGRLQPAADAAWPRVLTAAVRYKVPGFVSGERADAGRAHVLAYVDAKLLSGSAPTVCKPMSELLEPLDSLPPEQLATFIARIAINLFLGDSPNREPPH